MVVLLCACSVYSRTERVPLLYRLSHGSGCVVVCVQRVQPDRESAVALPIESPPVVVLLCVCSVYSLTEPERPLSSTHLQPGEMNTTLSSPSKFNISAALGETAVAFTFGPPQELRPVKRPFQIPGSQDAVTVWPVHVVKGNGDIMVTYSEVASNRCVCVCCVCVGWGGVCGWVGVSVVLCVCQCVCPWCVSGCVCGVCGEYVSVVCE